MRRFLLALVALVGLGGAYSIATNYTMTQGAGTTFGSIVVSAVNYAQQLLCDPATPSQCAAVSAGGAVSVSVTNANANGSATSANSSPVVIASDQVAVAVKAASGTIASGAIASGAVASGAVASGAYASGSIGSGAIASGAVASGAYASGALASGSVASGAMVDLGAQADAACLTDNGTCSEIALTKRGNQRLTTINTSLGGSNAYETVAASQTGQALGATGATGDYLSHCVIYPTTTTPGVVTVFDNTNAAGSNVIAFPGGASSVSNLAPISIPVGAISTAGAWKVTTGANLVVTCYGRFT